MPSWSPNSPMGFRSRRPLTWRLLVYSYIVEHRASPGGHRRLTYVVLAATSAWLRSLEMHAAFVSPNVASAGPDALQAVRAQGALLYECASSGSAESSERTDDDVVRWPPAATSSGTRPSGSCCSRSCSRSCLLSVRRLAQQGVRVCGC